MDRAWPHTGSCLLTSELKKKMALLLFKEKIPVAQYLTKTEQKNARI